jgi:hypothetical protein
MIDKELEGYRAQFRHLLHLELCDRFQNRRFSLNASRQCPLLHRDDKCRHLVHRPDDEAMWECLLAGVELDHPLLPTCGGRTLVDVRESWNCTWGKVLYHREALDNKDRKYAPVLRPNSDNLLFCR